MTMLAVQGGVVDQDLVEVGVVQQVKVAEVLA